MLPDEVASLIGKVGSPVIMEVEKGAIRKYADAIRDFNPIYWDEKYASNSRYSSIIAPPGFFGWPVKWSESPNFTPLREELDKVMTRNGYGRVLDGGIEFEFYSPVRAGDILTALPTIASISERETKNGKLVFSITETTYTNKKGDLVAKARYTLIHR